MLTLLASGVALGIASAVELVRTSRSIIIPPGRQVSYETIALRDYRLTALPAGIDPEHRALSDGRLFLERIARSGVTAGPVNVSRDGVESIRLVPPDPGRAGLYKSFPFLKPKPPVEPPLFGRIHFDVDRRGVSHRVGDLLDYPREGTGHYAFGRATRQVTVHGSAGPQSIHVTARYAPVSAEARALMAPGLMGRLRTLAAAPNTAYLGLLLCLAATCIGIWIIEILTQRSLAVGEIDPTQ